MRTLLVQRVITHAPDLKSFYVPREVEVTPGQFVLLWLPGVDEKPFSISGISDEFLEITIKAVGPFTKAMMGVEAGQRIGLRGPFGRGFRAVGPSIIVGGGCGVAPVRLLAQEMARDGTEFALLLGARSAADIMFRDEYERAGALLVTEDGSLGKRGLVTDQLEELIAQGRWEHLYAAGPEGMLLAIRDLADEHLLDYQLSFERYMKCGIGICGHCCMDGTGIRMCTEGPILSKKDLTGVTDLGLPHRDATGARFNPPLP